MKRITSILLLGLLIFNWGGYRLFSLCLEQRADAQLEWQFDQNKYDEAQLISIKIPMTCLAYCNTSYSFERVDGQIEIKGVIYKFVKRRLYNDSLEMLCIPNNTAMQLHSAKNNFFKLVNDFPGNSQGKKSNSHNNVSKNFSPSDYTIQELFKLNVPSLSISKKHSLYPEHIVSSFPATDEQPPDILC